MASPMTTGGQPGYGWSPAPTYQPPMGNAYQSEPAEMSVQIRPMALKVHYTFDREGKVNCLARLPQNLQVQTVPLDDRNWIGIVDIRLCIQAIAQGSPELLAQNELDFAIYAIDFSEPDTPLVGQGMMSWIMDPSLQPGASQMTDDTPKMVTGRVTKNMLGLFGNGARETLEVRLKLSESSRAGRNVASANTNNATNMAPASNNAMVNNVANTNNNMNHMGQMNTLNNTMMPNNNNNNNNTVATDGAMAASYNTRAGSNAPGSNAPTPTDTTEWNSFMQSNPGLGRSASISTMYQSPNTMPAHPDMSGFPPATQPIAMANQGNSFESGIHPAPHPVSRPGSQAASRPNSRQSVAPVRSGSFSNARLIQPTPLSQPSSSMGNEEQVMMAASMPPVDVQLPPRPVRVRPPRSRATGRPRGRPKKRPVPDGNTSAAEELPTDNEAPDANDTIDSARTPETNDANDSLETVEGDDAHKKKRAKTTKADYPTRTTLDSAPDSLRVAASTNGSLRTLRPLLPEPNSMSDVPMAGAHLQEFPRAPTPVPQGPGGGLAQQHARKMIAQKSRRESLADFDSSASTAATEPSYSRSANAHSPTDSLAPSPDNYTPEHSPADIGSSPPVPRTTSYVPQSSPMPSSPPLPPMRRTQQDSGFMSGGVEGLFDEDDIMTEKDQPPPTPLDTMAPTPSMDFSLPLPHTDAVNAAPSPANPQSHADTQPVPRPRPPQTKAAERTPVPTPAAAATQAGARPAKSNKRGKAGTVEQYEFKSMEPGPPELLPTTILYNPPPPPPKSRAKNQRSSSMVAKPNPPSLERSNSAPNRTLLPAVSNQPNQPSQLGQPSQSQPFPFPLPADLRNSTERAATQPPVAGKPQARTPASAIDVPDDMKELAKFLATSTDNDQDAVSLVDVANVADDSGKSPDQTQPVLPQQPAAEVARVARGGSFPLPLPRTTAVPASDPPGLQPLPLPSLPLPQAAFSEAACPPSDFEATSSGRYNKNLVRKAAIKERLQKAIESGQMPTFCSNCGAIETPTWRKMWTRDLDGEPEEYEFSEKPGYVTALEVLERDDDGKTKKYRLTKKALSSTDDVKLWTLTLLCNPCGIWLGKCKSHRPSELWDKDASRLTQPKGRKSRSKKSRAKADNQQFHPTSEAYFTTDPAAPPDQEDGLAPSVHITQMILPTAPAPSQDLAPAPAPAPARALSATATPSESPKQSASKLVVPTNPAQQQPKTMTELSMADSRPGPAGFKAGSNQGPASTDGAADLPCVGSTHSRGSGTAKSPIAVDPTRRLLFPSPRKEGVLKVLGELAVNVIGSVLGSPKPNKEDSSRFETPKQMANSSADNDEHDDMVDLFGTPPPKSSDTSARPSTPPPRSGGQDSPEFASGPFKTPTRPTPSHRPITRSVSKTIRSGVSGSGASFPKSPMVDNGQMIQCTPSKTLRSVQVGTTTRQQQRRLAATPGRTSQPQFLQHNGMVQLDNMPLSLDNMSFDTPFTSTLNKLLSEANDFTTGSPSHGLTELDLASLANLDSDGLAADFSSSAGIDFGSYLDANMTMSSSSPHKGLDKHSHHHGDSFGGSLSFDVSESMWSDFNDAMMKECGKQQK